MTTYVNICLQLLMAGSLWGTIGGSPEPQLLTGGQAERTTLPERPKVAAPEDISPVSKSNIARHVERLAALESRHITHPGNKEAEEYIISELKKYGYSPTTDTFDAQERPLHNVLSGGSSKTKPVILLSAHFDSTARLDGGLSPQAPGADDNASGVAAVLELARILKDRAGEKNLEFVFFNSEETGQGGSRHLSDQYKLHQWPIAYLINIDTIGTWTGPLSEECPVNYVTDDQSVSVIEHLQERFPYWLRKSPTMWRDDHASFWRNGFKAIEITEDGCTPYMHKPTDTAEKLQYDNIAKIVYGLYAVLGQPDEVPAQ